MIYLTAAVIISVGFMSFVSITGKKYGGTASATGKVTYATDYEKMQGRKVGDVEPINVTVECRYDDNAAAKTALKTEIENTAIVKKIRITSTINYDVTSCDQ